MFRVITTCHNAENYIEHCLDTLQAQDIEDWVCYVVDDMSTDSSRDKITAMAEDDPRIIPIFNEERTYQVGNYAKVMKMDEIDDDDICLTLDGDDWLPNNKVLTRLQEAYDHGAWLTYGQFAQWDGKGYSAGFAQTPPLWDEIRQCRYTTTHLRTWKAFLWRRIADKDLLKADGSPIKAGGDTAFMYPMLEMAGPYKSKYIPYYMYVYNVETPDNVHKHSLHDQHATADQIRRRPPYGRLLLK